MAFKDPAPPLVVLADESDPDKTISCEKTLGSGGIGTVERVIKVARSLGWTCNDDGTNAHAPAGWPSNA